MGKQLTQRVFHSQTTHPTCLPWSHNPPNVSPTATQLTQHVSHGETTHPTCLPQSHNSPTMSPRVKQPTQRVSHGHTTHPPCLPWGNNTPNMPSHGQTTQHVFPRLNNPPKASSTVQQATQRTSHVETTQHVSRGTTPRFPVGKHPNVFPAAKSPEFFPT